MGSFPSQALVEGTGKRVLVGAAVNRLAPDRFGSDALERSNELARPGQPARRGDVLDEPEVAEIRVTGLVEEHVGGLHVPVHEATRMSGVERVGDLGEDLERPRGL
jgi:hypothetical protein